MYAIKWFLKEKAFNTIGIFLDFKKSYNRKIGKVIDIDNLCKNESKILYDLVFGFCISVSATNDIDYFAKQYFLSSLDYHTHNLSEAFCRIFSLNFYHRIYNIFWLEILLIKLQLKLVN